MELLGNKSYLADLTYKEFDDLLRFVKSIMPSFKDKEICGVEEENEWLFSRIRRFFPLATATQEMFLNYLIQNPDEDTFNNFKQNYPDLEIDPTGKGIPSKKNYWEITLEALETVYEAAEQALNPTFKDKQVLSAKSLDVLKKEEYPGYAALRKLCLGSRNTLTFLDEFTLKKIENFFKEYFTDEKEAVCVLQQFLGYSWKHRKSPASVRTFGDHFVRRTECLEAEWLEHTEIRNKANLEFLESLQSVIKTILYKEK